MYLHKSWAEITAAADNICLRCNFDTHACCQCQQITNLNDDKTHYLLWG